MNERQRMLVVVTLLFVLVLISALLLIASKHQSRKLFVEVQQLNYQINELNTEWSRLQLEQSAFADPGRVEQIARSKLLMVMPPSDEVIFIKP